MRARAGLLVLLIACGGHSSPSSPQQKQQQAGSAAPVLVEPTVPPHCTTQAADDCKAFGYDGGHTTCTPQGDVSLDGCTLADPRITSLPAKSTCGNGKVDSEQQRVCAPCVPGHSCPCSTVTRKWEGCDGSDFDGQSCQSLGYFGDDLRCTKDCTLDTSHCAVVAKGHPFQAAPLIAGTRGVTPGSNVPAALGAIEGSVAAAWVVPGSGGQDAAGNASYDAAFAWSDPTLGVLRTSKPFPVGFAGPMQLGGNASGWLLAVATYADNPGPRGPAVTVYPISRHGHVGKPGARVDHPEALFLVRGNGSEPSLVGASGSAVENGQPMWQLDGWLVDERGEPLTKPFPIGTATPIYCVLGARAAYLGDGRFLVVRGSTRDPAIEISIVDAHGNVKVLPIAHPDLAGMPVGLTVSGAQAELAFVTTKNADTQLATFTTTGNLVTPPHAIAHETAVGMLRDGTLVTYDGRRASLVRPGAAPTPLLSAPGLYLPFIASAADASYALAITIADAHIVRLK